MASGLPVVGISSGGVTDFLAHRRNALLSEYGDQEAFTRNLILMMENETLRRVLSKNALKTALSRDWNEIFDALMNDYMAVIERKTIERKAMAA